MRLATLRDRRHAASNSALDAYTSTWSGAVILAAGPIFVSEKILGPLTQTGASSDSFCTCQCELYLSWVLTKWGRNKLCFPSGFHLKPPKKTGYLSIKDTRTLGCLNMSGFPLVSPSKHPHRRSKMTHPYSEEHRKHPPVNVQTSSLAVVFFPQLFTTNRDSTSGIDK